MQHQEHKGQVNAERHRGQSQREVADHPLAVRLDVSGSHHPVRLQARKKPQNGQHSEAQVSGPTLLGNGRHSEPAIDPSATSSK